MLRASAVIQWQCSAAQVARANKLFRATLKRCVLTLAFKISTEGESLLAAEFVGTFHSLETAEEEDFSP